MTWRNAEVKDVHANYNISEKRLTIEIEFFNHLPMPSAIKRFIVGANRSTQYGRYYSPGLTIFKYKMEGDE